MRIYFKKEGPARQFINWLKENEFIKDFTMETTEKSIVLLTNEPIRIPYKLVNLGDLNNLLSRGHINRVIRDGHLVIADYKRISVLLKFEKEMLKKLDDKRGRMSRQKYIESLIK